MSEFVADRPFGGMSDQTPSGTQRLGRWFSTAFTLRRRSIALIMLVMMLVIAALAPSIFITVPSGRAGVLWLRFFGGTSLSGPALGEGLHIIFPWDRIFIYDMRLLEHDQSYDVIGHDGLHFSINISFRWRLNPNTLPYLHKDIGPNYLNALLVPEIGSVVRERVAKYETEDLFAARRGQIQREIRDAIVSPEVYNRIGTSMDTKELESSVVLFDVLFRDIKLPDRVRTAIERKLEQAQISQEYNFRILRERLETERKQIEAEGIQAFQRIVQAGISDNYLKWRGVEATLQLAASQNAKVVIIGNGPQGLPLILNTGDNLAAGPPRVAATPPQSLSVRNSDGENAGQIGGSIDMTPPRANAIAGSPAFEKRTDVPTNNAALPAAVPDEKRPADDPEAQRLRGDETRNAAGPVTASDQPVPSYLQSMVAPFGFRLERVAPPPGWSLFSRPTLRR